MSKSIQTRQLVKKSDVHHIPTARIYFRGKRTRPISKLNMDAQLRLEWYTADFLDHIMVKSILFVPIYQKHDLQMRRSNAFANDACRFVTEPILFRTIPFIFDYTKDIVLPIRSADDLPSGANIYSRIQTVKNFVDRSIKYRGNPNYCSVLVWKLSSKLFMFFNMGVEDNHVDK